MTYSILQQQVREALEFTICYSVRKIRPSYSGYCMKVRRSSDNSEQEIGFIGEHLDINSLLDFCDGSNGFVSVWHNQGIDGAVYDVFNTTPGHQPQIVSMGVLITDNSKACVWYDGYDDSLLTTASPLVYLGTPISIFTVSKCVKKTGTGNLVVNWVRLIGNTPDLNWFLGRYYNHSLHSMYGNGKYWQFSGSIAGDGCNLTANSEIVWENIRMLATTMQDGTDNYLYCNGLFVSKTNNLEMPSFTGRISLGGTYSEGTTVQVWQGPIQEVIIYKSQKLGLRTAIENNINNYFNFPGYKVSLPVSDESTFVFTYKFSVRRINDNYTGYLMRVRRSSDNTEQDIGFDSNGDLDESTLLNFCGAGNGYVVTWYDQTGGKNFTQSDTSLQPQIVLSGAVIKVNSKPAVYSDGTKWMRSQFIVASQPTSYFIVGKSTVKNNAHYIDGYNSTNRHVIGTLSSSLVLYAGAAFSPLPKLTTQQLVFALMNGNNSKLSIGTSVYTGNGGTAYFADGVLFATRGGSPANSIDGYIQEVIIYDQADKSSTKETIEAPIREYYSIPDPNGPVYYSLRKLNTSYTGYCVKVRRSSDNTTQDIGFVNGVIDTTSLLSFCGSGDGFVDTWYDQGTHGWNLTQSTMASQPQIVSSGSVILENNKPTLLSDGSTLMSCSAFDSIAQPATVFIVGRTSTVVNDKHYIDGVTNRELVGTSGGKLCLYAGGIVYHGTKATTQELVYALFNSSNCAIGRNGGTAVTGNGGTSKETNLNVFNSITGSMQELIFYLSNQSGNRSTIESDINGFYSIY